MPASMTVAILNLLPGTTKRDVENHFSKLLDNSRPAVGPLVDYVKKKELVDEVGTHHGRGSARIKRVATTVTFEAKDAKACERARERKLNSSIFYPRGVFRKSSRISVKKEFLGLTPINEKPNHKFDFVFLHGLGGHAFHTWALKKGGSSNVVMWPRDLLPEYLLEERKLSGRYWVLGYNASPSDRGSALTTIEGAARNLINLLNEYRDQSDDRPLYFCAHSLGGLVLCKALALELWQDERKEGAFTRDGRCIVKGVAFFGTPFQGSPIANYMLPIAKIMGKLGRNQSLIPSLVWKDPYLAQINGEYGQLQKLHRIDMRIFTENLPLYKRPIRLVVTDAESASGAFGKDVKPILLNADHRTMVKFSGDRDDNWERVAEEIADMVSNAQREDSLPPEHPTVDSETSSLAEQPLSGAEKGINDLEKVRSGSTRTQVRDFGTSRRLTMVGRVLTAGKSSKSKCTMEEMIPSMTHKKPDSVKRSIGRLLRAATGGRLDASINKRFSDPVPNNPLVEWTKDDTVVDRSINSAPTESIDAYLLSKLREVDTVFILDDTISMRREDVPTRTQGHFISRWQCLIEAVRTFGDVAAHGDDDGIDVHFVVNEHLDSTGLRTGRDVLSKLRSIEPSKTPYLDDVLRRVLTDYVELFSQHRALGRATKPLNVIIITDGVTGDHEKIENTLVRVAKQLAHLKAPSGQVGVQFVQIGFDESATAWLAMLDDTLREMHGVRDMVDTRRFEANLQYGDRLQAYLKQILLGGIDRRIDAENDIEDSGTNMRSLGHGQTF
ncbi:MAG: hypothetical protein M1828_001231 [Chrysothrix sp. TS-e1954]|nr:MAG: hypothetical protein M1828_001231 [Chrysothrix sp. TS-e1954]